MQRAEVLELPNDLDLLVGKDLDAAFPSCLMSTRFPLACPGYHFYL
jgi:hypothetical protein